MTWSVACIIVASQREAEARTPTGARTTRITWKRAIGRFESRDTHHARVRGGREVRAPSLPRPRAEEPRDALFPRGTTSAARDTRRLRLRGSRASARTPGIAPDLRPTERAPKTQDRAHARAPGDRPARRTQPRGCVVAPRAPPATHAFLSRSSRPHPRRRGFLPRPSSAARAASSTPNPHDIDIAPFHRRSPRVCSRAKTSTRASHPRSRHVHRFVPFLPLPRRTQSARRSRGSVPCARPLDDDDDDNARRRFARITRRSSRLTLARTLSVSRAGVPPISCVTRIVESVKLEDFTRIALAVPPSVAAAVRVGTQCRVNGAPLLVASVRPAGRDGRDVVATFGVAMNSPLTSNLSSLRPDEEVRFEVDTESVNDDISDAAAIKRARETQGGLPGTREWYSNTLPWYTKMYPASEFEDSATSASADGSGSSPYEPRTRVRVPHVRVPTYESPTYESPTYESPTYESPTYESPTYESPTYESPRTRPPRTARPRRTPTASRMSARTVRSRRRARRESSTSGQNRPTPGRRRTDTASRTVSAPRGTNTTRRTGLRRWRARMRTPLTRPGLTARIRIARRGTTAPGRRSRVRIRSDRRVATSWTRSNDWRGATRISPIASRRSST